jgi:predicted TIM-barrel fold metal-dependent hydrolase
MLNLSSIPVVDNHCHPVLLDQHMDIRRFRSYCTEATATIFAEKHVSIYPHVYFDLSNTIPFVDKLEMLAFTRQALGVAPASKLLFSTDGIHVPELHWAGAMRGRDVIGQVLNEMIAEDEIDEEQAHSIAQQILHDTAYEVYQL